MLGAGESLRSLMLPFVWSRSSRDYTLCLMLTSFRDFDLVGTIPFFQNKNWYIGFILLCRCIVMSLYCDVLLCCFVMLLLYRDVDVLWYWIVIIMSLDWYRCIVMSMYYDVDELWCRCIIMSLDWYRCIVMSMYCDVGCLRSRSVRGIYEWCK
jgi:hypothetical protein